MSTHYEAPHFIMFSSHLFLRWTYSYHHLSQKQSINNIYLQWKWVPHPY